MKPLYKFFIHVPLISICAAFIVCAYSWYLSEDYNRFDPKVAAEVSRRVHHVR